MTEDEAKKKWCPFVRLCVKGQSAGNRYGDENGTIENPSSCRCIGSDCMAWRWADGMPSITGKPKNMCEGYCGLAGKQ